MRTLFAGLKVRSILTALFMIYMSACGTLQYGIYERYHIGLDRALVAAVDDNDATAVKTLLRQGADPNADVLTADRRKFTEIFASILVGSTPHDPRRMPPILRALDHGNRRRWANGNLEVLRELISYGADVNTSDRRGDTPVMFAAYYSNHDAVNLLLDSGARIDGNSNSGSALVYASGYSDPEMVRLLIKRGADVKCAAYNGATPLDAASARGNAENVALLIGSGAPTDVRDVFGRTAISYAAESPYSAECVELLIKSGARLDGADMGGRTPLSYAVERGSEDSVKLLVTRGCDVNAKDNSGRSPLSYASTRGSIETVNLLIAKGAKVDLEDGLGRTPLFYACFGGNTQCAQLLISNGANVAHRDNMGRNPLEWTKPNAHSEIVSLLRSAEASR